MYVSFQSNLGILALVGQENLFHPTCRTRQVFGVWSEGVWSDRITRCTTVQKGVVCLEGETCATAVGDLSTSGHTSPRGSGRDDDISRLQH